MGLFNMFIKARFVLKPVCSLLFCALLITGCSGGSSDKGAQQSAEADGTAVETVSNQGKLHFDAGISNLYAKEYDSAIEEFEKSLEYNPHSPSTLNNMGFAYFDKGDMDKAVEFQARALEDDPEFANAYFGLALALEGKGETEGAIKNWNEFLTRAEPGSKWAQKAQQHIDRLENADKRHKPL